MLGKDELTMYQFPLPFRSPRFFCLQLVALFLLTVSAFAQDWAWENITPASGTAPEARRNGVAIYDPVERRVIVFGGVGNNGLLNDLWAFEVRNNTWKKLDTTGTPPPPRFGFDAVYDPIGQQMVVWAGQGAGFFNDTWTLNLRTLEWREVSPAARPKARYGSASIFDPQTRSLVQFAGFTEEARRFQDTQVFSLNANTWTDATPAGEKPQIRCLLTGAYDAVGKRMIIYGGQRNGPLDDLWAFDFANQTWTQLTPATRPAGRFFATSFVDRSNRFFVFGGTTTSGNSNETWLFNFVSRQWNQVNAANPPAPRNGMMGAYLEDEDRFLIFGGNGGSLLNDVWVLRDRSVRNAVSVSSASYLGNALAPDSLTSAFGTNLATRTEFATNINLPTSLANTSVSIKDGAGIERLAQLLFVSPTQVNYLVPRTLASGPAIVTITNELGIISTGTIFVKAVEPGLFAANADGRGPAAAVIQRVRADNSQSYEPVVRFDTATNRFVTVPIALGAESEQVFLVLFGTGFRSRSSVANVKVFVGGVEATVTDALAQPEYAGLDQVNALLPRSLAGRGEVDVTLIVDGRMANKVRVQIQ